MGDILEILLPLVLCLGGLAYFINSARKNRTLDTTVLEKQNDKLAKYEICAKELILSQGLSEYETASILVQQGLTKEASDGIVKKVNEELEKREKKERHQFVILGSLLFFGGSILSIWSYLYASEHGGQYILTWGIIIAGALFLYKGLDL